MKRNNEENELRKLNRMMWLCKIGQYAMIALAIVGVIWLVLAWYWGGI